MSKTVGAVAVVVLIGLAAIVSSIVGALGEQNQLQTVTPGTSGEAQPGGSVTDQNLIDGVPEADYVIDLTTGLMTPLPLPIIRSGSKPESGLPRYAASRDGSRLAYVGTTTKRILRSSSPAPTAAGSAR